MLMLTLNSRAMHNIVAVIGASGAIGEAILEQLVVKSNLTREIYAFSQSQLKNKLSNVVYGQINYLMKFS